MSDFLNRGEVCKLLKISERTLLRMEREGRIRPAVPLPARSRNAARLGWDKSYVTTLARERRERLMKRGAR